jgi:hypothetical protein
MSRKLRYNDLDAVSFGIYRGQFYLSDRMHAHLAQVVGSSFNVDQWDVYYEMQKKGRA